MREEKRETDLKSSEIAEGPPPTSPEHEDADLAGPDVRLREPTAMQVFLAWEKLRLIYNGVLVFAVILRVLFADVFFFDKLTLESLIPGALGANLCFCAGPIFEGYLCCLGLDRRTVRFFVFGAGMLVAVGIAVSVPEADLKRLMR